MTMFSKFFNDAIQKKTCQELFHPWTSACLRAWLLLLFRNTTDVLKVFLPFLLIPVCYNGRDNEYPLDKTTFKIFMKILLNAFGSVVSAFYVMCLLRKVLGKFYASTIVVVPAILISPVSYILPLAVRKAHSQVLFSFVLEAAIKNSSNSFIKTVCESNMLATLVFMCLSGSIMYYLKKDQFPLLIWFIKPTPNKSCDNPINPETTKRYVENPEFPGWGQIKLNEKFCCDHNDLCDKHMLNGLLACGNFGICIELIKRIIESSGLIKSSPLGFLRNIVISTNYKFVKFIVAYGVLYRIANCYFNRKYGKETPKTSLLAGIIAGLAFKLAPNYYFLTSGFCTLVQLMWHSLGKAESENNSDFETVYNFPWSVISYGIFGGLLVHIRLFKPELLPKLAIQVCDMMSNRLTEQISERIQKLAMQTV